MFELEIEDLRTDDDIKKQISEFKSELIDMINDFRIDDDSIEKDITGFINNNRVHCNTGVEYHLSVLNMKNTLNALCTGFALKKHSGKFPHLLFKLIYKPENPYDAIVTYYMDGKVQECKTKIVIDKFDKTKLK